MSRDKTDFTNIATGRRAALKEKVSKNMHGLFTMYQISDCHFKFVISLIGYTNPMKNPLLKIYFYLVEKRKS